jgi:RNA polymerase sigma factor (sigma-70 family)
VPADAPEDSVALARAERDALARERLAAELAALPPVGAPLLAARLRDSEANAAISSGALVALLRAALQAHDMIMVETLFLSLVQRIEGRNTRWAARVVAQTRAARPVRESLREDLKQELTLRLWQQIARERDPAWELYFERALAFAQRRVARSYLRRNGYWPSSAAPEGLPALLLSRLAPYGGDDAAPAEERLRESEETLRLADLADLADLRALVARLPQRERTAIVMRFWLGAREGDIAQALGVTTRTVRNVLGRAYTRLRTEYAGQV